MTVANIADGLGVPVSEIVRKLITLGYMVSATQAIEEKLWSCWPKILDLF